MLRLGPEEGFDHDRDGHATVEEVLLAPEGYWGSELGELRYVTFRRRGRRGI